MLSELCRHSLYVFIYIRMYVYVNRVPRKQAIRTSIPVCMCVPEYLHTGQFRVLSAQSRACRWCGQNRLRHVHLMVSRSWGANPLGSYMLSRPACMGVFMWHIFTYSCRCLAATAARTDQLQSYSFIHMHSLIHRKKHAYKSSLKPIVNSTYTHARRNTRNPRMQSPHTHTHTHTRIIYMI